MTPASGFAKAALTGSTVFWAFVAFLGQWLFFYYIAVVYGASSLSGDFHAWTRNTFLIKGYVPGDTAGNLTFAAHALAAGYVVLGGAFQLIPQIRARLPAFHRWNGRVFLATALGLSASGFYMVWMRGAFMNVTGALAISLNGALIVLFAVLAWRSALARDFAVHRRWALRTYLVANGQWFFRVAIFAWAILTHGAGLGRQLDGPVAYFWEFGCYLLPLAILELYLRTKDGGGSRARYAMAGALAALAVLTGTGIFAAYMILWRPLL